MKTQSENKSAEIVHLVLEAYLNGHESLTVAEIAEVLDVTRQTVLRRIKNLFDEQGWQRITFTRKVVGIRDKNYGGIRQFRKVDAYTPTKRYLADLILNYRSA